MFDKEAAQTRPAEHHYWLLVLFLAVAVVGWSLWLTFGAAFVRQAIAGQVSASATTQAQPAGAAPTTVVPDSGASDRATWFTELGQTGDAFGSFNALLTAIAGALVAWAGYLQHQSLKEARIALVHAQADSDEERKHRQRQEFESLFFQLLQLTSKAADQIEGPRKLVEIGALTSPRGNVKKYAPGKMGNPGINEFARKVFKKAIASPATGSLEALLQCLMRLYVTEVFDRRPSQFGPYFRLLYQTFRHVAESQLESEADRIRYANIARGQIPEGAVLLLALNGLTEEGHKFIPLIERFGLLEHMHRRYKGAFQNALILGYRDIAFLGSASRPMPNYGWTDQPKLNAGHFTSAMHARKDGDGNEDMALGYHGDDEGDDGIDGRE